MIPFFNDLQVAKALGFELYYDSRGYDVANKTDCDMFIVSDRLEGIVLSYLDVPLSVMLSLGSQSGTRLRQVITMFLNLISLFIISL